MTDRAYYDVVRLIYGFETDFLTVPDNVKQNTYDIRLKHDQPVTLFTRHGVFFLKRNGGVSRHASEGRVITIGEINELFIRLCAHSVFSHENEIRNGYISVQSKYRVGLSGTAVTENGYIRTIKNINGLVFRIPRAKPGCSAKLFRAGIDFSKGILIAGEPSSGKTTILRDLALQLSSGTYGPHRRIAVIDERYEIGGSFDLGPCAELLSGYPKKDGITMALRSLAPELLLCDELADEEMQAVSDAAFSGIPMIASVHSDETQIASGKRTRQLLENGCFKTVVFLQGRENPSAIKKICLAGDLLEGDRSHSNPTERSSAWSDGIGKAKKKGDDAA